MDDVLAELSPMYGQAVQPLPGACVRPAVSDDLSPDEAAILALLDEVEAIELHDIAARALFGIARLQTASFGLDLRGLLDEQPGDLYLSSRP